MALRRQLLLMASLTLALPWAGREYVREMEMRVRQGQQGALLATAQAVAARVGSDTALMAHLRHQITSDLTAAYFAHPLQTPVVVDGYAEEWRAFEWIEQPVTGAPDAGVIWGQRDTSLYGLIRVSSMERRYYDPAYPVAAADHVLLLIGSQLVRIYTAAPGNVTVERQTLEGGWIREHLVTGTWTEQETGYNLELRMPLDWARQGVGLAINDADRNHEPALRPLVVPDAAMDELLRIFVRPGVRLSLVAGGWIVGQAGYFQQDFLEPDADLAPWLVKHLLGRPHLPNLQQDGRSGRFIGDEIAQGRSGRSSEAWYLWDSMQVGRVVAPVPPYDLVVVAEQSMSAADALVSGAFGRLLLYSLVASGLVAAVLLAYASVLSWRIRRLSRAAQQAVDMDGRFRSNLSFGQFPASRSRDEIGDLARTYQTLLARLQDYTQYLETLAGKLSHELRTPLAMVRSSLDNLAQVTEPAEQRVYLDRASEGLQRLSNILNSMSAAARLEQSLSQYELESFDCLAFFADISRMYRDLYQSRRVELLCETAGPWRVKAAPELLAQMCDKLLENAADFSGPDGRIDLVLARLDKWMRLQVINTGPPLPEALQTRIFDSLTSTRPGEGHHLGLGLYVVRLIVQHHHGQIRAFNHPDGGRVVFEILLPAEP